MKGAQAISPGSRRTAASTSSPAPEQWTVEELTQILSTKAFGPQDPVLIINVTDIKDRLAKFRDKIPDEEQPISKESRGPRIRATCALTIWDAGSKDPPAIEQTRKCDIYTKTLPSGERGAAIELESPFHVQLKQLQSDRKVSVHTAPEIQFSMQFVVMAANEHDTWPPVEMRLPPSKTAPYRESGSLVRFPMLAAKWHKLPRLPKTYQESVLDLIASQDNNPYRPKLGLKIDASWCAASTPLEVANAERRTRSKMSTGVSTPEPMTYLEKTDISIEWKFSALTDQLPPTQLNKFYCLFCHMKNFKEPMQLHFHLINSHPNFKFIFTLHLGRRLVEGTVEVELADHYDGDSKGSRGKDNLKNFSWQKPEALFELDQYLKGDETWLGKKAKRTVNLLAPRAPSIPRTPRSRSHDASKLDIPLSAVLRSADDVPDIPPAKKRKFRVPKAPDENTRFFRLTTKRPLEEGEMVSESDDDIDEEWILRKHADTIDSFTDTTREEKEFIQRFDRHMLTEDVSSDLHSSEALIRFCRINRLWLQEKPMRFEFHKKVATLKLQGCITRKTIYDCMKIIDEPLPKEDPDSMDIDTPLTTPKRTKPNTFLPMTPEAGDSLGRCAICHSSIMHPRHHQSCNNLICKRPDFHLACIPLESRSHEWLCSSCATTTPPHSTPPQIFHDARSSPDGMRKIIPLRGGESSPSTPLRAGIS